MPGLPATKYRKLARLVKNLGYVPIRVCGSHERYYLESHCSGDGHITLVKEAGEIPAGTLRNILKDVSEQTGIPVSRLKELLSSI